MLYLLFHITDNLKNVQNIFIIKQIRMPMVNVAQSIIHRTVEPFVEW